MSCGKGNITINKTHARRIEDGQIVKDLPLIRYKGELVTLFSVISPVVCPNCGARLLKNKAHHRYLVSSYGILKVPVRYWRCSAKYCRQHCADEIAGVDGSNSYTDEYMEIQYRTRYEGKCSLHNNRRVGEIYTYEGDFPGRAACPTTLWKYEQKQGEISLEKLRNTKVPFDGTLYIDGYWVKDGWRKFVEKELGRKLTDRQWKRERHKIIYVVSTKDYVVLDFEITEYQVPYFSITPMLKRIKSRFGEENIKRVVSDEDFTIVNAVKAIFPKAAQGFCVFHQLKNLAKQFWEHFKVELNDLPKWAKRLYEMGKRLITSDNVIEATVKLREVDDFVSDSKARGSRKKFESDIHRFLKDKFESNVKYLKKGFVPDTNNVMEQLFSFWDDLYYQVRSFKTRYGLRNFTANLYCIGNNRKFNTGKRKGYSPIEAAYLKPG